MNSNAPQPPSFFQSIRWPLVVVALLGGHVTLMMVAVTLSLASPSPTVTDDAYREAVEWDRRNVATMVDSNGATTKEATP